MEFIQDINENTSKCSRKYSSSFTNIEMINESIERLNKEMFNTNNNISRVKTYLEKICDQKLTHQDNDMLKMKREELEILESNLEKLNAQKTLEKIERTRILEELKIERDHFQKELKRAKEKFNKESEDISFELIIKLNKYIDNITNNGDIINVDVLRRLFQVDLFSIFNRKIPIRESQSYQELNNEIIITHKFSKYFEINSKCKHVFLTSFHNAVYNNVDFSELKTESRYTFELSKLVNQVFIAYKELIKTIQVHMDRSYSKITENFSTYSKQDNKSSMQSNQNGESVSQKRPDLCITDIYGRVLLKGELKENTRDLSKAVKEINTKHYTSNSQSNSFYEIGSFAFAAAGSNFELYFTENTKDETIFNTLNNVFSCNLNSLNDRINLVKNMICVSYLIELISTKKPCKNQATLFFDAIERIENNQIVRSVRNDFNNLVLKKVQIKWIEASYGTSFRDYYKKMENFYKNVLNKLDHCVQFLNMYIRDEYLFIITTPICDSYIDQFIITLDDFKKLFKHILLAAMSMHTNNYVHCDIRRTNIVYDAKYDKFLLIDFENIQEICKTDCLKHVSNKHIKPKKDIEMISQLISDFPQFTVSNQEFISKFKNLLNSNNKIDQSLFTFLNEK